MIELEKTYLAKKLPDLTTCESKEIIDMYIPKSNKHPKIRIRKDGDKYEITKKEPIEEDASNQNESTITLSETEFNELMKLDGKKVRKIRYYYNYQGRRAEIDVFQKPLLGLVLVDFEFETIEKKDKFIIPDFCLVDVTQEEFIAGGMICGKTYKDIKENLDRFNYKRFLIQ